jgi:hypothetical protein
MENRKNYKVKIYFFLDFNPFKNIFILQFRVLKEKMEMFL